ncbi:glycerol-3-phosphate dehydrogenase/oxidase [bacterium]|nr:glycerol-3-phosphate dehydrogenase/oxidase [bacterium]
MKRELEKLSDRIYDLVIVGGGIYGATAAWDAVLRGLSVALIDKGDFGGGTSANSLKTIHGGLRYLQQLDIKRMRESIRERRILMTIAPHLVHPLPCLMPTYGHIMKGKGIMRMAMWMNDLIGFDRNHLADPEKRIPEGKVLSFNQCREWIPQIDSHRFNGGALWYDAQMYNSDRLLISFILSAAREGASVANYVKAAGFLMKNQKVVGIRVCDVLTGQKFEIKSKMVLNCCGGWVDQMLYPITPDSRGKRFQLSTAMNLIVRRRLFSGCAVGLPNRFQFQRANQTMYNGTRILFFSPWRQFTLIGTKHLPYDGSPDESSIQESEIQIFLDEIKKAFPNASIRREEIEYYHKGFLPMDGVDPKTGEVKLTKHYRIIDHHREDGIEGLISLIGVKFTTARDVSEKAIGLVLQKLGKKGRRSRSHETHLIGSDIELFNDFKKEAHRQHSDRLSAEVIDHLVYNYGSEYPRILQYGREKPDLSSLIPGSKELLIAEVIHGVREEMAQKLADVVLRRTDLGSGQRPGKESIQACAEIMAQEYGWNQERIKREIEEVNAIYVPHGASKE